MATAIVTTTLQMNRITQVTTPSQTSLIVLFPKTDFKTFSVQKRTTVAGRYHATSRATRLLYSAAHMSLARASRAS